jgi:hypothetical protein
LLLAKKDVLDIAEHVVVADPTFYLHNVSGVVVVRRSANTAVAIKPVVRLNDVQM